MVPWQCPYKERGFTLLELIIASTIMVTSTIAFSYLLSSNKKALEKAEEKMVATSLANGLMEEIHYRPQEFLAHPDICYPAWQEDIQRSILKDGREEIEVREVEEGLKEIWVRLSWIPSGKREGFTPEDRAKFELVTLIPGS